ncbi:carbon monoxide dehydrogenase [Thioalkalicoccus limnaeus]|uniref:Carbon monoxide dehydrogenase n=1 Tax=Thioalkalicoccus limnaeus TaxID=120681 RepID=A0ABV4BHC7_9GAMM
MSDYGQRHRHGVTKHLVEGVGGFLVGSALVLLAKRLLGSRPAGRASGEHRKDPEAPPVVPAGHER